MAALTEAEARARAGLIDVESYDVFLDLTAAPVRSRTVIRFGCREPGATTFAELDAAVRRAVLNGERLGPVREGRLGLPGLSARNVLEVEAEVAYSRSGRGLSRFTDPADGADYVSAMCYPTHAPSLFCCFDQPDLTAVTTLSLALPPGWEPVANGPAVADEPWRFGPVPGTRPYDLTFTAGSYVPAWTGSSGPVRMSVRRRRSLDGARGVTGLGRFGETAREVLSHYERTLGVPCPYPKYDIVFVPELTALAVSVPGLMLVNESLLTRMADPGDDFVTMVCAHEVAHLWFGCHVSMRWWDDLWLDEAVATYMSYTAMSQGVFGEIADPWTAFGYREKPGAYQADELPGRQAVSSPVTSAAGALARPPALTYSKGASLIRQLAALIGEDAALAGLADYAGRFGGGAASLSDMVGCWSRACGRDLSGWAGQWLRTEGTTTLRADVTAGTLAVLQDPPRTQRIGIGCYDGHPPALSRVLSVELTGPRTEVRLDAAPGLLVLNHGDLGYAQVELGERTLRGLARVAMDVGDPLTEAVCWNAAWQMMRRGELAAADFAGLVIRRLDSTWTAGLAAAEVLLERAVSCADRYAPPGDRAGLREQIARAALAASDSAGKDSAGEDRAGEDCVTAGTGLRRAFQAGFAASAHGEEQLRVLRSWLPRADADLRGRILQTLSASGRASAEDLDALAAADPVGGEEHRAACRAMRPDAAAKEEAWACALSHETGWRMALAHARGVWVPGQEELMTGYRDRYFTEALPALDGREPRVMQRLGRMLYPATLAGPQTLAVSGDALAGLSDGLRVIVAEQEAIMRSVLAARAAARRPGLLGLLVEGAEVGGDVDGVLLEDLQRHDLQRALMGRGEHHRGGGAVAVCPQPVRRGHAPPVPRDEAGEGELGHRRGEVVADAALVLEELRGYHRADRVAAEVFRPGVAAPVTVEAGEGIGSAWLKLAAEHISLTHARSIGSAAADSQGCREYGGLWIPVL